MAFLVFPLLLPYANASSCSAPANTFSPGGSYSVVVPSGCTAATVQLWGAGGGGSDGSSGSGGSPGGGGGYITGNIALTPGNTLYVYVGGGGVASSSTSGGAGGTNGGGTGGVGYSQLSGSGGGGCSAISTSGGTWSSSSLNANILIVAAGGGGGASTDNGGSGGAGGGTFGSTGVSALVGGAGGGSGASQSSGGSGGSAGAGAGSGGGGVGTAYQGGTGGTGTVNGEGGGGGGCGFYGGGGGGGSYDDVGAAGGGGSSWSNAVVTSVTDTGGSTTNAGNPSGTIGEGGAAGGSSGYDGEVIITYYSTYSAPTVTIGSVSNSIVDQGQYQSVLATESGGSASSFTYNFFVVNSVKTTTIVNALIYSAVSSTTQLADWYVGANEPTNSPIGVNVVLSDGTSTVNSIYSTYNAYPKLQTPTLSLSNSLIDSGQYALVTPTIMGGAPNYVQNIIISNSISLKPINSVQVTASSGTAELLYFPSWYAGNTLEVNIVVTDSATTNSVVNSIYVPLGFNSILQTPTISPSAAQSNTTGQTVTFSAYEAGGTLPYTYNFIVYNSATNTLVANMLTPSNSFPYMLLSGESGTTLYANVFITDSANTAVTVNSVLSGVITVSAATTTTVPPCGGGICGSGGTGVSTTIPIITTVQTTTQPTTTLQPTTSQIVTTVQNEKIYITVSPAENQTEQMCNGKSNSYVVDYQSIGTKFTVNPETLSCFTVNAVNVTSITNVSNPNFTKVIEINLTVGTSNASVNATISYPCSIKSSQIAPFILRNGTWTAVTPFIVNATACTVSFAVPDDPIIALFETPTITTTIISTVPAAGQSSGSNGDFLIGAVVVVLAILLAAYYLVSRKTGRNR